MRPISWIFTVLIASSACSPDQNVNQLFPEITVAPSILSFGEQGVLLEAVQSLYISNGGRIDLEFEITLETDLEDIFTVVSDTNLIGPNETVTLDVHFKPNTFLDFQDTFIITSNDNETPIVNVPVSGTGVDEPLPDIELDALFIDFGTVEIDQPVTQYLDLNNIGRGNLELGVLTQTGSGAFRLGFDPSLQTVAPDNTLPLILTYTPTHTDGDNGTLVIPSNDPDESTVALTLIGNGGGAFEYPIAIIDCPNTSEPPVWVTLDGSDSHDPGSDDPLNFEWTLVDSPSSSQSELSDTVTDKTNVFTDVAGEYTVQLVVTNGTGLQSAPTKCLIDAIPADDLHIELTWDTSKADLDLHLMEDTSSFFERPGDCNFCNPNPNWGQAGKDDDPRLDLDDRSGYGPENINVKHPENGPYQLKVHYFTDFGDSSVVAKVRIYTYGVLTDELSRVLQRDEIWDVAQINWPAGTVGVLSEESYQATVRACY